MNSPMKEIRASAERSISVCCHFESGDFELIETCKRGSMNFTHIMNLNIREAKRLSDFLATQLHYASLNAKAKRADRQKDGA